LAERLTGETATMLSTYVDEYRMSSGHMFPGVNNTNLCGIGIFPMEGDVKHSEF
jgi:hypothetical protein